MTNLEKKRQMSDEEFTADYLIMHQQDLCHSCKFVPTSDECENQRCFEGVKAWLNSEVKE